MPFVRKLTVKMPTTIVFTVVSPLYNVSQTIQSQQKQCKKVHMKKINN